LKEKRGLKRKKGIRDALQSSQTTEGEKGEERVILDQGKEERKKREFGKAKRGEKKIVRGLRVGVC